MSAFSAEQLGFIFSDALAEVVSTTSGFSLDVSSSEDDADLEDMVGIMSLYGKNQGMVFISAEEFVIRVLCSYITGIPEDEVTRNEIDDTLCELVNMTAGNAKMRFNDADQTFLLSSPLVIRGQNLSFITKKRINVISRVLRNEEISIKMKVFFY